MAKKRDKPKLVAEVQYRIYELLEGGTLREPTEMDWGHESHTFDNWDGYESMETATQAVAEKGGAYDRYIILPTAHKVEEK